MPKKKGVQESKSKVKDKKSKKKLKAQAQEAEEEEAVLETPSGALNEDDLNELEGFDGDEAERRESIRKIKKSGKSSIFVNTTDREFVDECLEAHNRLRERHGALPLAVNVELGKLAQQWANQLSKTSKLQRYTGFAENVSWTPDKPTGSSIAEAWYSEIEKYDFNNLEGQKGTASFTQMIWKSTEMVGIAMMESEKNGYFVVVNYFPPGNIEGRFAENIEGSNEIIETIVEPGIPALEEDSQIIIA